MTRGPLELAALASAAVPDLDPASVEGVVTDPAHPFDVAFVQDSEHRRWVIRCPRTPAASAQLEQSAALLGLLARRLTTPVPTVKGWTALPEGGRAAVHAYLTGQLVDLAGLTAGSRLAAGLGRALAQLHNLDAAVYEEAGVPVYDAEAYRVRRLADLDRAAATGRVPTGLLGRWESVLEDVSRWRFQPVPTHGAIGEGSVLAVPGDDDAELKAFLGWESAQVADPADDLAAVVSVVDEATLDTVMEAYAHTRVQRPDAHLIERARLVDEMRLVQAMTAAVAADDDVTAERYAARLRRLDGELATEDDSTARPGVVPASLDPQDRAVPADDPTDDEHPTDEAGSAIDDDPLVGDEHPVGDERPAGDDRRDDDGRAPASDDAVVPEASADVAPAEDAPDRDGARSTKITEPLVLGPVDDDTGVRAVPEDRALDEGAEDDHDSGDLDDGDDEAPRSGSSAVG